jgi:hypothetical protein
MAEPAHDRPDTSPAAADALPRPLPVGVRIPVMLVAAAIAAAASLAAIERVGEVYQVPDEIKNQGGNLSAEAQAAANAANFAALSGNATLWLGISGAILAGLLALTTGLLRRAGARSLAGLAAGIVLGAGAGALAGYLAVSVHGSMLAAKTGNDLPEHQVMMLHGLTWGLVGLGVGLACGLSGPRFSGKSLVMTLLVGGVMGCLGGVAFSIVAGVAAPLANSSLPIPEAGSGRMIWIGLSSVLMGLGLGRQG